MELRVLRYYLAVAREENITRAADMLHLTQPTLSRQMMALEAELNTRLFTRSGKRIALTEAGMLLRRRAEELVTLADKVELEFSEQDEALGGTISIGSGVTAAANEALPALLQAYHQNFPRVRFALHTGTAGVIKDQLDKGLLDVGILLEPVEVEKYAFVRLPQKEVWGLLMPEDDPLAQKADIAPQDTRDLPLIVSWRIGERAARGWFGENAGDLNVFCTYDLLDNAALLVAHHMGYAFTIAGVAAKFPGLCFRPLRPEVSSTSVVAWKKYQPVAPAVRRFIDLVENAYKA